jgi:two-component system sensor kinase FixL
MRELPPEQRVLRIGTVPDGNGGVEIAVYNLGEPVPDEIKEKIFSPFFTTKAEGLGLGLCISRSLVEAHGGKMRVDAGETGGAKFWFTLPPSGTDVGFRT